MERSPLLIPFLCPRALNGRGQMTGCQMAAVALTAHNDKTSLIFLLPAFVQAVRMPIMTSRSEAYIT